MSVTRRTFMQGLGVIAFLPLVNACGSSDSSDEPTIGTGTNPLTSTLRFTMPDEGEPHTATWMAYGATEGAWGTTGVYGVSRLIARKDLMRIAAHLSRFEPVKMLVTNSADKAEAQAFLNQIALEAAPLSSKPLPAIGSVTFIVQPVNDLWMRDTAPVFVLDADKKLSAVNFNFNGWGQENTGAAGWVKDPNKVKNGIEEQPIADDRKVADFIIGQTGATKVSTWLVMEGGGVEVNGKGTAICTESCILNPNRNPNKTKADVEAELFRVLGIKKVIWLKGNKAKDITDGHVDFYARFVGDSTVVYTLDSDPLSPDFQPTQDNKAVLESATDANGHKITAIALTSPDFSKVEPAVLARNSSTSSFSFNTDAFAAGYVGFYLANNCVLMAGFGDATADAVAYNQLKALYPSRTIVQITTDGLANGGGTIHCATQQQIAV